MNKLFLSLAVGAVALAAAAAGPFDLIPKGLPGGDKLDKAQRLADWGSKAWDLAELNTKEGRDKAGQAVALAATNKYGGLDERDTVQTYVTMVGLAVARVADPNEKSGKFVFGVLDSDEPAACSGPGGYVMVTRGALKLMADESELAGVLAHEISHVVRNHGLDALKGQKMQAMGQQALNDAASQKYAAFSQTSDLLVDAALNKPFSRKDESEADKDAILYLGRAGYDPNGFARFLTKLQASKGNGNQGAFATHPSTKDRIKDVEKAAKGTSGATNAERFAKMTAP